MATSRKLVSLAVWFGALALGLTACGGSEPSDGGEAQTGAPASEPVTVRVAHTPFFDHQWVVLAEEFGWDQEHGINFELRDFAQVAPSVQAMVNGSIDIVEGCIVCNFPFRESVPELTVFLTEDQFKGFLFIGREGGDLTPYDELLEEHGDAEAAKSAALEQFEGRTFAYHRGVYDPLVSSALSQVGLSLEDIEILNFADDEKAALAFIRGEGDVYTGSLPQESRMLLEMPDQFINLGGAELLGPAGLWYSNMSASSDWIDENRATVYKMLAMSYRYNRIRQEQASCVLPAVTETINRMSGSNQTVEQVEQTFDEFLQHRTYQEEREETYNADSPLYWKNSASYYVEQSVKNGEYPSDGDYESVNRQEEIFTEFLEQDELLQWVDAPIDECK